jgi:hypothetical protein
MKTPRFALFAPFRLLAAVTSLAAAAASAATIQTLGSRSAVSVAERIATFDSLNSTNTQELGNYSEGGLYITTGNQSWGADPPLAAKLDPFHGATAPDRGFFCVAWDNPEWTSIRTTNLAVMHAVEFVYGNGWTTGDIYGQYPWGNNAAILIWQTWRNGTLISSNSVGGTWMLPVGTVVGFFDPAGFDELTMKAIMLTAASTNSNALALDNVMVQLTYQPPAPLLFGTDFSVNPTNHIPSLTVWDTLAGLQYRLVYSENVATNAWTPVTPPLPSGWVAGGGSLTFTDSGAPGPPRRFYRVEVR